MQNYATQTYVPGGSHTVANASTPAQAQYPFKELQRLTTQRLRQRNAQMRGAEARPAFDYAQGPEAFAPQQAQAVEGPRQPQQPGYVPSYVKMVTGPGIVPGYQRAARGDPGAVASGFIPRDEVGLGLPNNAQIVTQPGFAPDPGPDLYSPQARRASYGPASYRTYRGGKEVM